MCTSQPRNLMPTVAKTSGALPPFLLLLYYFSFHLLQLLHRRHRLESRSARFDVDLDCFTQTHFKKQLTNLLHIYFPKQQQSFNQGYIFGWTVVFHSQTIISVHISFYSNTTRQTTTMPLSLLSV